MFLHQNEIRNTAFAHVILLLTVLVKGILPENGLKIVTNHFPLSSYLPCPGSDKSLRLLRWRHYWSEVFFTDHPLEAIINFHWKLNRFPLVSSLICQFTPWNIRRTETSVWISKFETSCLTASDFSVLIKTHSLFKTNQKLHQVKSKKQMVKALKK